jgi:hypothetical protein
MNYLNFIYLVNPSRHCGLLEKTPKNHNTPKIMKGVLKTVNFFQDHWARHACMSN